MRDTKEMGALLASGNGKRLFIPMGLFAFAQALVIVFLVLTSRLDGEVSMETLLILVGISLGGLVFVFLLPKAVSEIHVYENGVRGKAVGKGIMSVKEFDLAYGDIRRVDTAGKNMVVLAVRDVEYNCYCKNPADIQKAIMRQRGRGVGTF